MVEMEVGKKVEVVTEVMVEVDGDEGGDGDSGGCRSQGGGDHDNDNVVWAVW